MQINNTLNEKEAHNVRKGCNDNECGEYSE